MLRQTSDERGVCYINAEDVETAVTDSGKLPPLQLSRMIPQTSFEVPTREDQEGGVWIETEACVKLLKWYAKEAAPSEHLPTTGALIGALETKKKNKRKHARKYRWLVAYRQGYLCFSCKELLHPDAWECDHHQELRDGGSDFFAGVDSWDDNLRALCSACHDKKTRKRTREGVPAPTAAARGNKFSKYFRRPGI